jgi:hypothetical protein
MGKFEIKQIETANIKIIEKACLDAMRNSKLIAILGDTGYGKTSGLKYFAKSYDNVFYFYVRKSMKARPFFDSLIKAFGDNESNSELSVFDLVNKAAFLFNQDATNKLLIIDEAGKLTPSLLEYLHEFRDLTDNSTGIIIAGPFYFQDNCKIWVRQKYKGIPEVYRRINYWQPLYPPNKSEIISICELNGVKDKKVINQWLKCQNFGDLSNLIQDYHYRQAEKSQK